MKRNSNNSSPKSPNPPAVWLAVCCVVLSACLGCESVQRKFTRKSAPKPPPNPIITFEDYTKAMTPLDRYRKHYLMFDYWNSQLIEALHQLPLSPKRLKRSSTESLGELETMRDLLADDVAARLAPLIEERKQMHQQLTASSFSDSQTSLAWRVLETQTRQIQREFFWRDVEDHVKAAP